MGQAVADTLSGRTMRGRLLRRALKPAALLLLPLLVVTAAGAAVFVGQYEPLRLASGYGGF